MTRNTGEYILGYRDAQIDIMHLILNQDKDYLPARTQLLLASILKLKPAKPADETDPWAERSSDEEEIPPESPPL